VLQSKNGAAVLQSCSAAVKKSKNKEQKRKKESSLPGLGSEFKIGFFHGALLLSS
jgi:hypothetical protein